MPSHLWDLLKVINKHYSDPILTLLISLLGEAEILLIIKTMLYSNQQFVAMVAFIQSIQKCDSVLLAEKFCHDY